MRAASTPAPSWQQQALAERERRRRQDNQEQGRYVDILRWPSENFYIPETEQPIELAPHQKAILRIAFPASGEFPFTTVVYSTVKKSGKTAIAGMVARWAAECWGPYQEILCLANDFEQAAGRDYKAARTSIELSPGYDLKRKVLPGRWLVRDKEMTHYTSRSTIRALASDYKGEAGGNPSLSLWSELWGYDLERMLRLWDELTPSPVRKVSMRWVETYAGWSGESTLLYDLFEQGTKRGDRLHVSDLEALGVEEPDRAFAEACRPNDVVPIWVNEDAALLCYWDSGERARRMVWQTPDYYDREQASLRESAYNRFHLNFWASRESAFINIDEWDDCKRPALCPVLPDYKLRLTIDDIKSSAFEALLKKWVAQQRGARGPMVVIGVDASVSKDCTAMVVCGKAPTGEVLLFESWIWTPADLPGGKMNYERSLTPALLGIKAVSKKIVRVEYDPHQLHGWATRMHDEYRIVTKPFSQGNQRLLSDKQLCDLIEDRRIYHSGRFNELREHLLNSAAKIDDDGSRLRIVKKGSGTGPIDGVVALSMASYKVPKLNIAEKG